MKYLITYTLLAIIFVVAGFFTFNPYYFFAPFGTPNQNVPLLSSGLFWALLILSLILGGIMLYAFLKDLGVKHGK